MFWRADEIDFGVVTAVVFAFIGGRERLERRFEQTQRHAWHEVVSIKRVGKRVGKILGVLSLLNNREINMCGVV
jgi:hypothetical protein